MEFLQPAEAAGTLSKRQSLEGRRARQNEKARAGRNTNIQSTTLEAKTLMHTTDDKLLGTTKTATEHEMREPHITDDRRTLSTVIERQEPAAMTVSPPSSAVDDAWDFLSDSPQKVAVETTNQQVCYITQTVTIYILSRFVIHHLMVCGISLMMMLCLWICQHV